MARHDSITDPIERLTAKLTGEIAWINKSIEYFNAEVRRTKERWPEHAKNESRRVLKLEHQRDLLQCELEALTELAHFKWACTQEV